MRNSKKSRWSAATATRRRRRGVALTAACVAALIGAGTAVPAASAEVIYSPLYWQLLDKYASVEATWAPIRGVYGEDPECALAQQQGQPIACGQVIVIMNPDGSFGDGWVDDPAAPNGWRAMTADDCLDPESPMAWLCWG
jgi:hypothetical protein